MKAARWRASAPFLCVAALAALRIVVGSAASRFVLEPNFGDVGQWLDTGDRMLRGQLPYRDFLGLYGPLLYAWCAPLYRLAGSDWFAANLQLEVLSPVLCLVLAYLIAVRALRLKEIQVLFLAAVFALGLDRFSWAPALRVWLPLACVVFARQAAARRDLTGFRRAALAAGACLLVSIEAGCAALLACAVIALGRWRQEGRRGWEWGLSYLWWVLAPALFYAASPRAAAGYFEAAGKLARFTNWYGGLPFPPFPFLSLAGAVYYGPALLVGAAAAACAPSLLRARTGRGGTRREEDLFELALAVFGAVLLRSLLARTHYTRLLFCLAPCLLLGLRLCERLKERRAWAPLLAGLVGLAPFLAMSAVRVDGEAAHLLRAYQQTVHPDPELEEWPEEGLIASRTLVERSRRLSAEIDALVPPGEPVLSLPLPLYAHLARRPSALPAMQPDNLFLLDGGPEELAARLDAAKVSVAVLDPRFQLGLAEIDGLLTAARADGLAGRLTWSTPADEAVARDLRAYLLSRFRRGRTFDGASFFLRAAAASAPRRARTVLDLDRPEELAPEQPYRFALPGLRGAEIRIEVRCRYRPGLGSLAKTVLDVAYLDAAGRWVDGSIPVPPEELGRDIRFPVAGVPLKALVLRIRSPGLFNPAPVSVQLRRIALESYAAE